MAAEREGEPIGYEEELRETRFDPARRVAADHFEESEQRLLALERTSTHVVAKRPYRSVLSAEGIDSDLLPRESEERRKMKKTYSKPALAPSGLLVRTTAGSPSTGEPGGSGSGSD